MLTWLLMNLALQKAAAASAVVAPATTYSWMHWLHTLHAERHTGKLLHARGDAMQVNVSRIAVHAWREGWRVHSLAEGENVQWGLALQEVAAVARGQSS
jgi:hypothetical protein